VFRHNCSNNWDTAEVAIFSYCRRKCVDSPVTTRIWESAHSNGSSRRDQSATYDDDEDSGDSEHSRTPKIPRIEDIADLVQKRLN